MHIKHSESVRASDYLPCLQEKQYPALCDLSFNKFIVGIRKHIIHKHRLQFIFNDGTTSNLDSDSLFG